MVLCLGLIASSGAAAKKKPRRHTRTVEGTYTNPSPVGAAGAGGCFFVTGGCVQVAVGSNERFISVEVEDDLGTDVFASAWIDLDGDQVVDETYDFCTKTEEPIEIHPGVPVLISIWEGPGLDPLCFPAASSSGKVTAVLSNVP